MGFLNMVLLQFDQLFCKIRPVVDARCVGWIAHHFECLELKNIGPVQLYKYTCIFRMVVHFTT
jgi:hypothetical protein